MSDITSVLESLRDGTITTADAVSRLAARQWPVRRAHQPSTAHGDNLAADVADGSFGEVAAAFAAGWLNDDQYYALAEAYGQAAHRGAGDFPGIPDTDDFTDADGDMDGDTFDWRTAPDVPARQEDLFAGAVKDLATAEQEVYTRGVQAWTPETKATPHEWATGRVEAFRRRAAGEEVPGYSRDDDLLG